METNPWQVDSIDAFICFKCPECQFYSQKDDFFQNHALENHPLSIVLFERSEEIISIKVEEDDNYQNDYHNCVGLSKQPNSIKNSYPSKEEEINKINENDNGNVNEISVCEIKNEQFEKEEIALEEDPLNISDKNLERNKIHICTYCGKDFKDKSNFKRHVSLMHEGKKRIPCEIPGCKTNFASKQNLKLHIRAVHEGEKPHKCNQCSFRSLQGIS